jgi:hypothetical protein
MRRYYYRPRFAFVDLAVGLSSLFLNPYRCCRKYFHVYGETPLSTFQPLAEAAGMNASDVYVELGSGRGKTCFWAALFTGCQARGVEIVPHFVLLSRLLARTFGIRATFEKKSMFEADLSDATIIYLYHLTDWRPDIPKNARLITISEPYPEYRIIQELSVVFPWGKTVAYIQTKF